MIARRESELQSAVELLTSRSLDPNRAGTLILSGSGGIGKTVLARAITDELRGIGFRASFIPLDDASTKSPLGLLSRIAIDLGRQDFKLFLQAVSLYQGQDTVRRQQQFSDLVELFRKQLATAVENGCRTLICFDNLDRAEPRFRRWLLRTVGRAHARVGLLVTTRKPEFVEVGTVREVGPLELSDVRDIVFGIAPDLPNEALECVFRIGDGNPLQVTSLSHAAAEFGNSVLDAASFEEFFQGWFRALSEDEQKIISCLAIFRSRFNEKMLLAVREVLDISWEMHLRLVERFPFVDRIDEFSGARLHDAFEGYVISQGVFSRERVAELLSAMQENYYEVELLQTEDPRLRRILEREKLANQAALNRQTGIGSLCGAVQTSIDAFDFDQADALLNVAPRGLLSEQDLATVDLMRCVYLLETHGASEAIELIETVAGRARDIADPEVSARVLYLRGKCATAPSPVPHSDLFEAMRYMDEAREICKNYQLLDLRARIDFDYARALRSAGQNDTALSLYESLQREAVERGQYALAVRCLEEVSQTRRLMQDLLGAGAALDSSFRCRGEFGVSEHKGFADYYSANLYRDRDLFDEARRRYDSAESTFDQVGDINSLCGMYGDRAWLEYLDGEAVKAREYQNRAYDIASRYRFGAELAEYWHTMYHLASDDGDWPGAYRNLARGLDEARRSNNMYMILDCLMHSAQKAVALGTHAEIEPILGEMQALERRGCGIRVFRGRALMFQGDASFKDGRLAEAYEAWLLGLKIVAKFGNSRTNVELFDDILQTRTQDLETVLDELDLREKLKSSWESAGLATVFPALIRLCEGEDLNAEEKS